MNDNQTVSAELHSLGNLMKRRGEKSLFCRYHRDPGLTDMQTRIIGFLYDHRFEDVFQKNIEQAFSMRRPSVSILIQEMEAKQLVARESVPYDARLKKVVLTDKSLRLAGDAERKLCRLEEMLTDDTLYAFVRQQLPLFRDYVAWKWKLAPHEAFLLQREHEHLEQMRNGQTASGTHDPAQPHDSVPLPPIRRQLPHGPKPPRPNLLQRLFGHKEEGTPPNSKRPRPVSHFEQKMLQEMRK